jgi:uroporphyrinogen decarboxylase
MTNHIAGTMSERERVRRVLHYEDYDRLPIVHFGYWRDTLRKWASEGHITDAQAKNQRDGNPVDREIAALLGFDFDWHTLFSPSVRIDPPFERRG